MGKSTIVFIGFVILLAAPLLSFQAYLEPNIAERLLLERPAPEIQQLAVRARVEGMVRMIITVSESGSVVDVRILAGHPMLNGSAVDCVRQSVYRPYAPDGKAVPFTTTVELPLYATLTEKDYDRDRELAKQYFEEEEQCRKFLNASDWARAEESCVANLKTAEKLHNYRGLVKMQAFRMAGDSVAGRDKYKEAAKYYKRALKYGESMLGEDNVQLGDLYMALGSVHSQLGKNGDAKKYFSSGEKTFQRAFESSGEPDQKSRYLAELKSALQNQIRLAEDTGKTKDVVKLKERLESLP